MFAEYVSDFKEFNILSSKNDLEFLAKHSPSRQHDSGESEKLMFSEE
jgi:hypothetical protein